ncbi:MAG: nucleoside 2-deoxyribosyltransferase [Candidatus Nanoarchaeia archaeon]
MRVYIAYKFLGSDKDKLKNTLCDISSAIEKTGNQAFIFYRDTQNWGANDIPVNKILPTAFAELEKSDVLFAFVENEEKSEGLLLEVGYAKAKNKKIFLAIKKDINLRFLKSIADELIEFDTLYDLNKKIKDAFG